MGLDVGLLWHLRWVCWSATTLVLQCHVCCRMLNDVTNIEMENQSCAVKHVMIRCGYFKIICCRRNLSLNTAPTLYQAFGGI